MFCDWEGNCRSGVALAVRQGLKWFIHLRPQGLSKGDEHSTNTLHGVWYSLPFHVKHDLCRVSVTKLSLDMLLTLSFSFSIKSAVVKKDM